MSDPKETRTYLKLHDGMVDHPKLVAVGGDAGWLHLCAMSYCSRNLTDGIFPAALVPRLSDRKSPAKLAAALVAEGIWHADGHGCDRCDQPGKGQYVVHDYLVHQRSKQDVEDLAEKRRAAGSKGGNAKARGVASATASATGGAVAKPKQTGSKRVAVTDTDTKEQEQRPSASASPSEPNAGHLVQEWIDLGGGVVPDKRLLGQVSSEMKRLLDEGVPYGQVQAGMRVWHEKALAPSVLKSVVHGVRTGTGQYANGHSTATAHRPSTTDARVQAALDLAAQFGTDPALAIEGTR